MAATVSIKEVNGAVATPTTVTAIRFCTDDVFNAGSSNPLVVPSSGNNYSFVKTLYLNADTAPSTSINNVKFFSDGAVDWTGMTVQAKTAAAYTQATGTVGATAPEMTDGVSLSTYTAAAPLAVAGSIGAATGKISDYVLLQAVVSPSAVAGAVAAETFSFRYDEI